MKQYDVAIIGAGVTGTAILYVLSKYTNVENIALVEKYDSIASVQSSKNNNSQTLHFGDIETHYTPQKAMKVKQAAQMVQKYVENYATKYGINLFRKFHKMALAVGKREVETLRARQKEFSKIFPKLHLIGREELEKVEPKVVEARSRATPLCAAFTSEGYAINYGALSESFVREAQKEKKNINVFLNEPVTKIVRSNRQEQGRKEEGGVKREKTKKEEGGSGYIIKTKTKQIAAKVVIVAASANSLTFAHKMGYGKNLILLPVAGDFFCAPKLLNGKVYMMQNPKLPFAAIHGDPDVVDPNSTRLGPIAKVLPILEKRNYKSVWEFLKLFRFKWSAIASIVTILKDPTYYRYVFWNVLYGLPYFGKYFFLREVRKIVPSIKPSQLTYGRDIGGIRPQVVDITTRKVALGEAKLVGEDIIFNITPSPGASVCLKNAENDVRKIVEFLGKKYKFDETKLVSDLQ